MPKRGIQAIFCHSHGYMFRYRGLKTVKHVHILQCEMKKTCPRGKMEEVDDTPQDAGVEEDEDGNEV